MTVRFPPPDAGFAPQPPDPAASPPPDLIPDLIDVFAVFAEAGAELSAAASALYAARALPGRPPPAAFVGARSAAHRVLKTIADCERTLLAAAPGDGGDAP